MVIQSATALDSVPFLLHIEQYKKEDDRREGLIIFRSPDDDWVHLAGCLRGDRKQEWCVQLVSFGVCCWSALECSSSAPMTSKKTRKRSSRILFSAFWIPRAQKRGQRRSLWGRRSESVNQTVRVLEALIRVSSVFFTIEVCHRRRYTCAYVRIQIWLECRSKNAVQRRAIGFSYTARYHAASHQWAVHLVGSSCLCGRIDPNAQIG